MAAAASTSRRVSTAQSDSGSSIEIGPSRCPVLWATRYGASAKARPPTSAAPSPSPSDRSQSAAKPPAPRYESSTNAFQAPTVSSTRSSGHQTSANGQPAKFMRGSTSGWNEYGSSHGAAARSIWCPGSHRLYAVCRWSPGVTTPGRGKP